MERTSKVAGYRELPRIYSDKIRKIEAETMQKSIEDFSQSAFPTADCDVLGCNTYGCLSSGKCEG